jgi:hypothetical protein
VVLPVVPLTTSRWRRRANLDDLVALAEREHLGLGLVDLPRRVDGHLRLLAELTADLEALDGLPHVHRGGCGALRPALVAARGGSEQQERDDGQRYKTAAHKVHLAWQGTAVRHTIAGEPERT